MLFARTSLVLALAAPIVLAGCLDAEPAPDGNAQLGTEERAALAGPHPKFTSAYTEQLRPFGFEGSLIAKDFAPYALKDAPLPKEVPLLLVLAERRQRRDDGSCPSEMARPTDEIEKIVFGGGLPSVRNFFAWSSHGRFNYTDAGVAHVCGLPAESWIDNDHLLPAVLGQIGGTVRQFDRDGNGVVTTEELTMLVLDDWDADGGQTVGSDWPLPGGATYHGYIATASSGASFFVWVHELGHTIGADDLYGSDALNNYLSTLYGGTPNDPDAYLMMDAWHAFRLGWLRPDLIDLSQKTSGTVKLFCSDDDRAEVEGALLFHDPKRGHDEYFLAEVRCHRGYDVGTRERGVAIWQVAQQQDTFNGSAAFGLYRFYAKGWAGCAAGPTGGSMCMTPSVCLHDTRSDNRDVCRAARFLRERATPFTKPLPLWWADRTPAGVTLSAEPMIEYEDYGIPGYHHVEHLIGYEVTWQPS
jgi:hypothetical protein